MQSSKTNTCLSCHYGGSILFLLFFEVAQILEYSQLFWTHWVLSIRLTNNFAQLTRDLDGFTFFFVLHFCSTLRFALWYSCMKTYNSESREVRSKLYCLQYFRRLLDMKVLEQPVLRSKVLCRWCLGNARLCIFKDLYCKYFLCGLIIWTDFPGLSHCFSSNTTNMQWAHTLPGLKNAGHQYPWSINGHAFCVHTLSVNILEQLRNLGIVIFHS